MPSDSELRKWLSLSDEDAMRELLDAAYRKKLEKIGKRVSIRGLIEFSNICAKNCYYCGIRKGNRNVNRFRLEKEEVLAYAERALELHYGSLVLQSGEIESEAFTSYVETLVREIRQMSGGRLGITLSCGEQTPQVYERWRKAGAHRYLLRIESSDPEFYRKLHPADHDFERRKQCLRELRKLDYQVGSGVMSGLPGQTVDHLVRDIRFFEEFDLDMIGMGPYIPHEATPLGAGIPVTPEYKAGQLAVGLKMIACTRLVLPDVNIASTTALQALDPHGREKGILAGGNVIMPNVSGVEHRPDYQLYAGKPVINETSEESTESLKSSMESIGEKILWDEYGDSLHYLNRNTEQASAK